MWGKQRHGGKKPTGNKPGSGTHILMLCRLRGKISNDRPANISSFLAAQARWRLRQASRRKEEARLLQIEMDQRLALDKK